MRYGIRDFLLVTFVVCGLAISSIGSAADDPASAPASATPASASGESADQPVPATADESTADESTPASEPAAAIEPNVDDQATKADHPAADAHGASADTAGHATAAGHGTGGDHGDAHHDPYDLTHVNATAAIADPSEIKSDLAIWTFVVFLCLLALLAKFAWGPIMEGLERREASIAAAIDEAEQAAAKGAEQLKLYEAKLAAAAEETREMLAQARKDAEATGERIISEAQQTAAREREKAIADITSAKNTALAEITERSVDLAVSMAGRMIQRQLTPDDRAGLIREALDQLPNRN